MYIDLALASCAESTSRIAGSTSMAASMLSAISAVFMCCQVAERRASPDFEPAAGEEYGSDCWLIWSFVHEVCVCFLAIIDHANLHAFQIINHTVELWRGEISVPSMVVLQSKSIS